MERTLIFKLLYDWKLSMLFYLSFDLIVASFQNVSHGIKTTTCCSLHIPTTFHYFFE